MSLFRKKHKRIIRFSNATGNENSGRDGKFFPEQLSPKGQLFILAAHATHNFPVDEAILEMVKSVIREVYYSDPSQDIITGLQNAFEDANTLIYEVFNKDGQSGGGGVGCTCLVMTMDSVYIAQVGNIGIFRVTRRKVEELTKSNSRQSIQSTALGLERKLYFNISQVSLKLGDCFLQCNERLLDIGMDEVREIVRSNTPKLACKKLIDSAGTLMMDGAEVQIIWISSVQLTPDLKVFSTSKNGMSIESHLAISVAAFIIVIALLFKFSQKSSAEIQESQNGKATIFQPVVRKNPNAGLLAEAQTFFEAGELAVALKKYQEIILAVPGELAAAHGVQLIGENFKNKADLYFGKGYHEQALVFYRKVFELLPDDKNIQNRIAICEKKLAANFIKDSVKKKIPRVPSQNLLTSKEPNPADDLVLSNWIQTGDWDFKHLTIEDFKINGDRLIFSDSPNRKKLINQTEYADSKLRVGATFNPTGAQGLFGIIIDYKTGNKSPFEEFYVFSVYQQKEFLLQRYSSFKKELLMRVLPDSSVVLDFNHIRFEVITSGAYMEYYADGNRILTWTAEEQIQGRVGFYVSPNIEVEFYDFEIEGR